MRVLFVNPYFKPYLGGIERIIDRVSQKLLLKPEVEDVAVLTTRAFFPDKWIKDLPSREIVDGITLFRCKFFPSRIPRTFHAALAGYVSWDALAAIRTFRPDIVHFTYGEWWGANLWIYLWTPRTVHVVSTIYHDVPHMPSTLPLYRVNRWLIPRMDAIHVLTEMEKDQVERSYKAPSKKTHVIPPGVDKPRFVAGTRSNETVTVLAVGRLSSHKGQLRLARALTDLKDTMPERNVRLDLVGDDAGEGAAIQALARRTGGLDIRMRGHCSDEELDEAYASADIFALPSGYESFGLVYMEAMAHGLPVVAQDIGPIKSLLSRGAIVLPAGDDVALRSALARLIEDREYRVQLGREGRVLVGDRYTWDAMTNDLTKLYASSLRARRR